MNKNTIIISFTFITCLFLSSFVIADNEYEESNPSNAYGNETWFTPMLVRVYTSWNSEISKYFEVVSVNPNGYIEIIIQKYQLITLDQFNYEYDIIIRNIDLYKDSVRATYPSLTDMESFLNDTAANYSNIVNKFSIGTTYEGRNIWCLEISDNPGVDEGEPGVLFMGLHHAREWPSVAINSYIIENLTTKYNNDTNITDMINNRRIWIVPCVNPDGYHYDHDLGNDWRKNRHYFPQWGTYGVDLNRNYGGTSNGNGWGSWGSVAGSVAHSPSDSLFCGPTMFSENETQAIKNIFINNDINIALSFHTYSELVIWPWGYSTSAQTPDDAYLSYVGTQIANRITRQGGSGTYTPQQAAALYPTSGSTLDWAYGSSSSALSNKWFYIRLGLWI
jgi:hypothetical protein